jgi:hypothetical protein
MIRTEEEMNATRLTIGARVAVRKHITDPDYPDLPLGGWRGKIVQSRERPEGPYLVEWSTETLESLHPVYGQRCEEDDLCLDQAWLLEEDLEFDAGGPLSLEHPTDTLSNREETGSDCRTRPVR